MLLVVMFSAIVINGKFHSSPIFYDDDHRVFSEPTHNIRQVQPILVGLAVELLQQIHIDVVQHHHHQAVALILAAVGYLRSYVFVEDR